MYTAHRRNIISLSERLLKYLLCLDCKRFLAPLVHPASEEGGEELIAAAAFIVKRERERERELRNYASIESSFHAVV